MEQIMTTTFKHHLEPDFQILERVPEYRINKDYNIHHGKTVAIIDLETTGLDYAKDKITEIGVIHAAIVPNMQPIILDVYQAFNDPGVPISQRITELTGITDEMVKGQAIDWAYVQDEVVRISDLVICHNASFDRKFLEVAGHDNYQVFKEAVFACTKNDIDWLRRGYGASKLDYLNWKLGYFYDAHRAINDCWATLNLLVQEDGALEELLSNTVDQYEVYAVGAPYEKKDELSDNGFYWNNGSNGKPKAWFKITNDELLEDTKHIVIECRGTVKTILVPSNRKYSSVQ